MSHGDDHVSLPHPAGMPLTVVAAWQHLHATSEAGHQGRGALGEPSASGHSARGSGSTGRGYVKVHIPKSL